VPGRNNSELQEFFRIYLMDHFLALREKAINTEYNSLVQNTVLHSKKCRFLWKKTNYLNQTSAGNLTTFVPTEV